MELGLVSKRAAEGAASSTQKRAKGAKTDKQEEGLVKLLAKLTLSNSQDIRVVSSVVTHTVVFEKEQEFAKSLIEVSKKTTADYMNTVKQMEPSAKSKFQAPHVFIWHALLKQAHDFSKQVEGVKEEAKVISNYLNSLENKAIQSHKDAPDPKGDLTYHRREVLAEEVKACRIKKCYSVNTMRLEVTTINQDTLQVLNSVMSMFVKLAKGVRKTGAAPRGDLERRISAAIGNSEETR
eukprot:TRINITY_DN15030_c0_g1_i1.p2 TRINITY_DN15030_c0_g1~~TRINITY_DN15030_c0_g1_i1.p2  ORF type:complete len:237 (-),score=58.94 TRINITY_DN15030_c0_g1_i1:999-1709(-)